MPIDVLTYKRVQYFSLDFVFMKSESDVRVLFHLSKINNRSSPVRADSTPYHIIVSSFQVRVWQSSVDSLSKKKNFKMSCIIVCVVSCI